MYVDRPRPSPGALALPLSMAAFFAAMGSVIAVLAVLFLPPVLWMFALPVLALCAACAGGALWYARSLFRLSYEVGAGRLTIRRGGDANVIFLADVGAAFRAGRAEDGAALGADRSGVHSARAFANRDDTAVLLKAGGEWVRLSPSDPEGFLQALWQEKALDERC